jgi:hypothetical protein
VEVHNPVTIASCVMMWALRADLRLALRGLAPDAARNASRGDSGRSALNRGERQSGDRRQEPCERCGIGSERRPLNGPGDPLESRIRRLARELLPDAAQGAAFEKG